MPSTINNKGSSRHVTNKVIRVVGGLCDVSVKNSDGEYIPIYKQSNPSSHRAVRVLCNVLADENCPASLSVIHNPYASEAYAMKKMELSIQGLKFRFRRVYKFGDEKMMRTLNGCASGGSSWVSWKCSTKRSDLKATEICNTSRTTLQNTNTYNFLRVS